MQWHIAAGWNCVQAGVDVGDEDALDRLHTTQRDHIVDFVMHAALTPAAIDTWESANPISASPEVWSRASRQSPMRRAIPSDDES